MEKEQIKQAFFKVKQDINSVQSEMIEIKKVLSELYDSLNLIKYGNIVPTDRQTNRHKILLILQ